ncbi:hypothetical protein J1605_000898 [Eschrichtius robustus]|uniref:F-actin-capping protein subunit beta n=1 Tax=Eschrichtius robustus TaxID=9764 RepID=A0AB34GQX7_ESCRO|nr:hypothetical protein J1605_000898 [Eschrichtius robustus]
MQESTLEPPYFEGGVSSVYLWDLDHGFAGVILIKKAGDGSKKIKGCWDSIHVVEVQEKSSGRTAHYKLTSTVMLWLQTNKSGSGTMNLGGSLTRQVGWSVPPAAAPGLAVCGGLSVFPDIQSREVLLGVKGGAWSQPLFNTHTLQSSWPQGFARGPACPAHATAPPRMEKDETVSDCSPHIANIGRLVEDMENKIRSTLNEIYFGKTKDIVNGLRSVDVIPDNPKFLQLQRELSQVLTQRQIHIQPDN